MLVNHGLKMVFIHAAKCAGITLTRWLIDNYGFSHYRNPDLKISGSEIVERHRFEIPAEFQGSQVITCIREPFQRWESFYLYQTLQMGVNLPFDQFTRERLKWLPRQTEYTRQAHYILRVENLAEEVKKLPFVEDPAPPLPRLNISRKCPGYDMARKSIEWTEGTRELVRDHFKADFTFFGVSLQHLSRSTADSRHQ